MNALVYPTEVECQRCGGRHDVQVVDTMHMGRMAIYFCGTKPHMTLGQKREIDLAPAHTSTSSNFGKRLGARG